MKEFVEILAFGLLVYLAIVRIKKYIKGKIKK